jgi:hypothetical protein
VLEQLLQHLTGQDDVWFARCREVATWCRSGTVSGSREGVPQ